jgi:hypothetical protein
MHWSAHCVLSDRAQLRSTKVRKTVIHIKKQTEHTRAPTPETPQQSPDNKDRHQSQRGRRAQPVRKDIIFDGRRHVRSHRNRREHRLPALVPCAGVRAWECVREREYNLHASVRACRARARKRARAGTECPPPAGPPPAAPNAPRPRFRSQQRGGRACARASPAARRCTRTHPPTRKRAGQARTATHAQQRLAALRDLDHMRSNDKGACAYAQYHCQQRHDHRWHLPPCARAAK